MARRFQIVDVFGGERFKGNPVAVVAGADDLSMDEMQDIARWLNLSETTFLLQPSDPQADYHVRIFTLDRELPFAGHPTLGTCHAWLTGGGKPKAEVVVQQCGAGLVPVRRSEAGLAFAAPPLLRSGPVEDQDLARALEVLGIDKSSVVEARWVDNGPGWLGLLLQSAEAVLALRPLGSYPERVDIGVVGAHPPGSAVDWELRAIFSDQHRRLVEDPITGSLNASVAQWLISSGLAGSRYTAAQGTAIGRVGRIAVEQDHTGAIWVGGNTETLFSGKADF
jgi:PhzF family phenazine biosynthesis protein